MDRQLEQLSMKYKKTSSYFSNKVVNGNVLVADGLVAGRSTHIHQSTSSRQVLKQLLKERCAYGFPDDVHSRLFLDEEKMVTN